MDRRKTSWTRACKRQFEGHYSLDAAVHLNGIRLLEACATGNEAGCSKLPAEIASREPLSCRCTPIAMSLHACLVALGFSSQALEHGCDSLCTTAILSQSMTVAELRPSELMHTCCLDCCVHGKDRAPGIEPACNSRIPSTSIK